MQTESLAGKPHSYSANYVVNISTREPHRLPPERIGFCSLPQRVVFDDVTECCEDAYLLPLTLMRVKNTNDIYRVDEI